MDALNLTTTNFGNRIFDDKNLYIIILVFDLILGGLRIAALLICPYFIIRVIPTSLIHGNFKILLCYLPIGFLMVSVAQGASQLSTTFISNKETTTFWTIQQIVSGLYIMSMISCAFSILSIMVERSIAVFKRPTYEKRGNAIGFILIFVNVIGSIVLSSLALLSNILTNGNKSMHHTPHWNLIILVNFLFCGIISLLIHYNASCRNQKFTSYNEQNNLSDRFQCQENKATLRIIRPILIFIICSSLFSIILTTTLIHIHPMSSFSLCQRISDSTLTTICLFFIIIILRRHEPLRKAVARDCFCTSHKRRAIYATSYDCPSARALHDTFSHFDKLEEIWNRCSK